MAAWRWSLDCLAKLLRFHCQLAIRVPVAATASAFADCRLDIGRHRLECAEAVQQVKPQVFDLLLLLVQNQERRVTLVMKSFISCEKAFSSDSAIRTRIAAARTTVRETEKFRPSSALLRKVVRCWWRMSSYQATGSLKHALKPGGDLTDHICEERAGQSDCLHCHGC